MRCPFPGMDPYLERPAIWPDFHDSLIAYLREALQPLLRPRYVALTQDRLYMVETERPIRPDVAIVRTVAADRAATAVLDAPDEHLVFELSSEEISQPLIHIVEPAAGNRIVTAIEVLSPDNKTPGPGRASYAKKCDELWAGGANFVEIDLLRGGVSHVRASHPDGFAKDWTYSVAVRRQPDRCEVYLTALAERLSRIGVPLAAGEADVVLDLQAAFERCWDAGPYPELLGYEGPPPLDLSPAERNWCAGVAAASRRS